MPKTPKLHQMNSCSCTCRQQTSSTVNNWNLSFYSDAACSSYPGTTCNVTLANGSTASGKWESCIDYGKVWVRTIVAPGEIPTVVARPGDIQPPPPPP